MTGNLLSFLRLNPYNWRLFLDNLQLIDLFDILLTAVLIYLALWFVKRTRSWPALFGIISLLIIYALAYWLNLSLTYRILQTLLGPFIIILAIIFQDEIKRFFYLVGSFGFKKQIRSFSPLVINELIETVFKLADQKIGALIIIPGQESLTPYLNGGINLNANFSQPLLLSLFDPHSPGHDGAVIFNNDKLEKFAVYLPLSKNDSQLKNFGTRHRAALGLAEKADALILVVSEEKGIVSVAQNGKIKSVANKEELKEILSTFLASLSKEKKSSISFGKVLKDNVLPAVFSIFIAFSIWAVISYPNLGIIQKNFITPFEFSNVNNTLAGDNVKPLEVIATFSGRSQDFKLLNSAELKVVVDLKDFQTPGKYTVNLSKDNLQYPSALTLINLEPNKIQFALISQENLKVNLTTTTK